MTFTVEQPRDHRIEQRSGRREVKKTTGAVSGEYLRGALDQPLPIVAENWS
jgi:hypothetical protein